MSRPGPCLALLALALLAACRPTPDPVAASDDGAMVRGALGGTQVDGFERALEPRPFRFPEDHGPHPGFRTEWWYFTGNLDDDSGRRFGFQLTFFRFALSPQPVPAGSSAWRTNQVWMAHLAVSDPASSSFHAFERFQRGAMQRAGAQAQPLRVWLGAWSASALSQESFPLRLLAAEGEVSLDLTLNPARPMVLQGERGLSRKSALPGNASYYYSYTRMTAAGRLDVGDGPREVRGTAWMDREWSTSALGPEQAGWDWFALQLEDGRDLMFYRLRQRDGSAHPASAGILVQPDGSTTALAQVRVQALEHYQPPEGAAYPIRWQLELPGEGIRLEVAAVMAAQLHQGSFRYWEGAVDVTGQDASGPLRGRGYLEMTPY